jgi:hypothetical protein
MYAGMTDEELEYVLTTLKDVINEEVAQKCQGIKYRSSYPFTTQKKPLES